MSSSTKKTILVLAANPKGTEPLRLDKEVREIDAGLQRAKHREQFVLEQKWAVRPRDIQRAMLDINPSIVHFSGHGTGDEGLVFEDETGATKLVDGEALAGVFELFAEQVECVVLNGCYSEVQATVIARHVNYVIGMNKAIGDQAAIEFAVAFYDALGAGRPVEFAHKFGCAAIRLAGIPEHLTPVIKKKPGISAPIATRSQLEDQPVKDKTTSKASEQAIEVFFSYAHEDENLRDELAKHLKLLQRQGIITAWYDREISAGTEWAGEIDVHMDTANIILLLISADFLASDYCYDIELTRAMERHANGEARVIPVILREVDWKGASVGKLQALPKNARPITSWVDRDAAFADVARGIRKTVESLVTNRMSDSLSPDGIRYDSKELFASNETNTEAKSQKTNMSERVINMGSGNYNERIQGNYVQGNYYAAGQQQSLAEAAAEIQKLLEQLDKSYPIDTTLGKMQVAAETIKAIENNPIRAERVTSALKAGGVQALAQLLNHPAASFVIGALEDWQKTKEN